MHYYKRNIGDYSKKAGRLSILQHGIYNLLIDACYDREKFPTLEEAIDWTWAGTKEEIEAVEFVLRKFFTLEDGVYVQARIQEEIATYHGRGVTNTKNGKKGGRPKKNPPKTEEKPNGFFNEATESEPHEKETLTTNQEPLTTNQEKITYVFAEQEFDLIWSSYPKREGSNPKPKAFSCFKARIAEGCRIEDMAAGVARYLLFCQLKGWIKTSYVMQGTRFFGPSKEFENDWEISDANHNGKNPQHGLQHGSGSGKLSTVGRNNLAAERYLENLHREASEASGDDGAIVAEAG